MQSQAVSCRWGLGVLTSERRALILELLWREGRFVAKSFSQEIGLSEDTIRRDLRELAAEGLLQRVHGGALPSSPAAVDLRERWSLSPESKDRVARAAARLVRPGQVVILDGGTTAVRVAAHLAPDLRATVITHSPSVAVELARHQHLTVDIIGGRLFKSSVVAVGAAAMEAIARIRADIFFLGATGVHPDLGFTTGDSEDATVKRALSRQAGETYVLASAEKLGAVSPFQIMPLNEVEGLIVEPSTSEDILAPYRAAGVAIL